MERQKVLYVARTKTAKVLRSNSMKQPPQSQQPRADHAPLASEEPELLAALRKASTINKSSNSQARKTSPQIADHDDSVFCAESVVIRPERPHKDLVYNTYFRTYVKLRNVNEIYDSSSNKQNSTGKQKPITKESQRQPIISGVSPSDSAITHGQSRSSVSAINPGQSRSPSESAIMLERPRSRCVSPSESKTKLRQPFSCSSLPSESKTVSRQALSRSVSPSEFKTKPRQSISRGSSPSDFKTDPRQAISRGVSPSDSKTKPKQATSRGVITSESMTKPNKPIPKNVSPSESKTEPRRTSLRSVSPSVSKTKRLQTLSCGVLPSESISNANMEHNSTDKQRPLSTQGLQNFQRGEISRRATNRLRTVRKIDKKSQRAHEQTTSSVIHGSNGYSTQQNGIATTPPTVAPKPKRICTKSISVSDLKPHLINSEHELKNHETNSSSDFDLKGSASKEDNSELSPTEHSNILEPTTCKEKLQSDCRSESNYVQSSNNFSKTQNWTDTFHSATVHKSSREHNTSDPRPDITVPTKFSFHNKEPLPEMYTFSAPQSTSDTRPTAARRSDPPISHAVQSTNVQRKPLVAIDTSFNTTASETENKSLSKSAPHAHETRFHRDTERSHTHTLDANQEQWMHNDLQHSSPVPDESTEPILAQEFKNSWNRSSMRLATHGYTSMSDLSKSFESLNNAHQELTTNNLSQRHIDTSVETSRSQGGDRRSVLHKHRFEENCDDEINEPNVTNETVIKTPSQEDAVTMLQRSGVTRLSYRMATSTSLSDISMISDEMNELFNNSHQKCIISKNNKNRGSGVANNLFKESQNTMKNSEHNEAAKSEKFSVDNLKKEPQDPNTNEDNEHGNKLKRLSFTLATCSISDLTFPSYGNANHFSVPNSSTFPKPVNRSNILDSTSSGSYNTPESPESQNKDGGCYSGSDRHSSFGSVYSYQSLDSGKIKHPVHNSATRTTHQYCNNAIIKEAQLMYSQRGTSDSSDSESSASLDTTFYYTASSDTSFITANGDVSNSQHYGGKAYQTSTQSPRQQKTCKQSPQQDQSSPKSTLQSQIHDNKPHGRWSPKIPANGRRSPKMSPRNRRRDGLSPTERSPTAQDTRDTSQSSAINSRQEHYLPNSPHINPVSYLSNEGHSQRHSQTENEHMFHDKRLNDRNSARTQIHSTRNGHCKMASTFNQNIEKRQDVQGGISTLEDSPNRLPIQTVTSKPADSSDSNGSARNSLASSSSFCSVHSLGQDSLFEETPRFPPSLGKPRRKLYAGFDSQPLPMDSYISDSSSIYSMQTCGSWGTSRSAEVERSPRNHTLTQNTRAVSSIVASTYAPVRSLSQEEMLDLLKYTDKVLSIGESIHNFYPSDRSSYNYKKSFSSESLKSARSDDTIVGDDHISGDNTLEYTKLLKETKSDGGCVYNNAFVSDLDKTRNERRYLDKLNNSVGRDFGSKMSNNTFVNANVVNNKSKFKAVKGKKYGQPFCLCGQSSVDRFPVGDGGVSVILRDTGQWDVSL